MKSQWKSSIAERFEMGFSKPGRFERSQRICSNEERDENHEKLSYTHSCFLAFSMIIKRPWWIYLTRRPLLWHSLV